MAITNATTLADYAAGISTQNATLKVDSGNKRVGIGTTNPQSTLQVGTGITMDGFAGVITAQSYYGDGSTLTGIGQTVNVGTSNLFVVGVSTLTGFTTTGSDLFVAGIATVGTGLSLADNIRAKFGNAGDLAIYHDGTESWIKNDTGTLNILNDDVFQVKSLDDSKTAAQFNPAGEVALRYNDSVKFRTINSGVSFPEVVDIAGDLKVAGITTVGVLTAYSNVAVGVGATIHGSSGNAVFAGIVTATTLKYGSTSVETAIDAKASTGKAIAMAMVFGF